MKSVHSGTIGGSKQKARENFGEIIDKKNEDFFQVKMEFYLFAKNTSSLKYGLFNLASLGPFFHTIVVCLAQYKLLEPK